MSLRENHEVMRVLIDTLTIKSRGQEHLKLLEGFLKENGYRYRWAAEIEWR